MRFNFQGYFIHVKYLYSNKLMNKKLLAPARRQNRPAGGQHNTPAKKTPIKLNEDRSTSGQKSQQMDRKYQERFRNKNLQSLPAQLLLTFSTLTTIDVSYNKLTDADIQLMIGSCTKLQTFCIQGNLNYLIPSAVGKLKYLVNFRHDWCKLNPQHYQTPERLRRIMENIRRPDIVTKINRIVGIDFIGYCQNILQVHMDRNLLQKIQKVDVSSFARSNMLKIMGDVGKGKIKQKGRLETVKQSQQSSIIPGCFGLLNVEQKKKWRQGPHRKQPYGKQTSTEADTDIISSKIKIEDIRDMHQKQTHAYHSKQHSQVERYSCQGMPLHKLFSNFDKNPNGRGEIDALLLNNYNPNQYDQNGLSPYHVCVIHKQKKGLQYLLQISSNNPGFFDLEMASLKQGRNILHYCVFLKNYSFTKQLIQFGLPVNRRDLSGARIVHLVDENVQFLLLLRKLIKKRSYIARSLSVLSVPHFPPQNKKNYVKNPHRQIQECNIKIVYSKNDNLLNLYEAATGIPKYR